MSNHDHGAAAPHHLEGIDHLTFGAVIQCTGGLIKHQETGMAVEGPGQGQTLPLTTRELMAVLPNRRQQAVRQL